MPEPAIATPPAQPAAPATTQVKPTGPIPPDYDLPLAEKSGTATLVLAGGCFWGMQAVFQQLKGVTNVVAGYTGGLGSTATYEKVIGGTTGHAEAVQIEYDPSKISVGTLLQIFFFVAHDPTQLNRQGPDVGTQYRSSIFTDSADEKRVALSYIKQIDTSMVLLHPIATKVKDSYKFYRAEGYHQNYVQNHPTNRYVLYHDLPKVAKLKAMFPKLCRAEPLRFVPEERRKVPVPPK